MPRSGVGLADEPAWICTLVRTGQTAGSFCYPTAERCETERRDAQRDGAQADPCQPTAPVACFQLGGDPGPRSEACAATMSDCELLRLIDRDRWGQSGAPCAWRHGASEPPGQEAPPSETPGWMQPRRSEAREAPAAPGAQW